MGGVCWLAHSPLELLPALGQALGFISHQVQHCTSYLLLEGAPVPADAQAEEGGWRDTLRLGGGPKRPPYSTPARGCRMPGPAAGPPPSASWLPGGVLAAAASGRQLP